MKTPILTRENLTSNLDVALAQCRHELDRARQDNRGDALIRDLQYGLQALDLIYSELHGGPQRPKGQRSAMFTRYVIDEEERIVMPAELRDLIVQIENRYSRF